MTIYTESWVRRVTDHAQYQCSEEIDTYVTHGGGRMFRKDTRKHFHAEEVLWPETFTYNRFALT